MPQGAITGGIAGIIITLILAYYSPQLLFSPLSYLQVVQHPTIAAKFLIWTVSSYHAALVSSLQVVNGVAATYLTWIEYLLIQLFNLKV